MIRAAGLLFVLGGAWLLSGCGGSGDEAERGRIVVYEHRLPATCAPACGAHTDLMTLDPFRSQECQRPVRLGADATATLTVVLGRDPRRCHFRTGVPSGP